MAPTGRPRGRPRRKGRDADTEPTAVVPDDADAGTEGPGPTEAITVHPGGALNARFFIPGLDHCSPAPATQPPTSHVTPRTPPPPVTPVPQQSTHRRRRQADPADPDGDNPFTSTAERSSRRAQPLRIVQFSGAETFNIEDLSEPSTPTTPTPVLRPVAATPKSNRRRRRAKRTTAEMPNIPDLRPFYEVREDRGHCIFCSAQKKSTSFGRSTTSTSNWRRHLLTKHLGLWVEACDRLKVKITADNAEGPVAAYRESKGQDSRQNSGFPDGIDEVPGFSLEAFIDALVAFIVSNDQSFNVVESPELRRIFLMLREELTDDDIPRRTQIRKRVMEIWEDHLKQLSKEMQGALGKISFTCDMWSNANLVPFMAVTAHWIETKEVHPPNGGDPYLALSLRADLIGFHRVPGRHDGEHLARAFLFIVDRLRIASKMGWISLDNASNNDTMMAFLETLLMQRGIEFDAIKRHIRCFAHIVNLACKAVLTAITNIDYAHDDADFVPQPGQPTNFMAACRRDPIATARSVVRLIRGSSIRRQIFSEILESLNDVDNLQLLRDVITRWSSTLLMIERVLYLRPAIDSFLSSRDFPEFHKYQLSNAEWGALSDFKNILAVPHAFQQILSCEKTPCISDTIPAFEAMQFTWEELQKEMPHAADIIAKGLEKFAEYRARANDVPIYSLAILIHPAYKLQWFQKNLPGEVLEVKDLFINTLRKYKNTPDLQTPAPQTTSNSGNPLTRARNILRLDKHANATSSEPQHSLYAEVERYLSDPVRSDISILMFWQENQKRYPTIFSFALDVLPIQGTSVPSERVFSSGKETDTLRRNRLGADSMEALQMLKYSVRKGRGLNFTEGTDEMSEIRELELLIEQQTSIPEDMQAFIKGLVLENGGDTI
ncbi:uncharacterized protein ARMOST_03564 [Armillaria ostoyae]|uniref:HAT C-terminal dimerisation domain-containing protein n=1 Tax=Armillaria ostoyae TaxID=47428 RepID=A0A284QUW5_ARMOS|nr:uncharacterized protein ARMOST_03564 [Armillaria ostoyae]